MKKLNVYIVSGMYNDDIDYITGNPYLKELVTTDFKKALDYFNSVSLKSRFNEIEKGVTTKVDDVVTYVQEYTNVENSPEDCFMDITLDKCNINAELYHSNIDGCKIREYVDYYCETIEEKKLFFDGTVGDFL